MPLDSRPNRAKVRSLITPGGEPDVNNLSWLPLLPLRIRGGIDPID